jgi:hypothetical protein
MSSLKKYNLFKSNSLKAIYRGVEANVEASFCTSAKVLTVNQRFSGQNLGRGATYKNPFSSNAQKGGGLNQSILFACH